MLACVPTCCKLVCKPWYVLLQDDHDALADNYKRAQVHVCRFWSLLHDVDIIYCAIKLQEEKDNMEGRWNALVVSEMQRRSREYVHVHVCVGVWGWGGGGVWGWGWCMHAATLSQHSELVSRCSSILGIH